MRNYEYFPAHELRCQCSYPGCDGGEMDEDFMELMAKLRKKLGPLLPTSAYRCPKHNNDVSSTGFNGPHTTGHAIDIRCLNGRFRWQLIHAAIELGFNRIGIARTFVHLDDLNGDPYHPEVIWLY